MARNKKPASRSSKPKSEVIVAHCKHCNSEKPVSHVLRIGASKKWSWDCKTCGNETHGTRRVQ